LPETTSATPTKPSASPPHCRAADFLAKQPAGAEGGQQRLHADHQRRNAGRQPCLMATNTPPRYSAWTSTPVTPMCSASRAARAGHGARVASAISRHQRDHQKP
jgi:hypothetical protein